jgi:hypothetical protein
MGLLIWDIGAQPLDFEFQQAQWKNDFDHLL